MKGWFGVVNSLIGNGMRYTTENLLISGNEQEGYLVIQVEDDGSGFPTGDAGGSGCDR